ncbi:hypothetical protein ACLKA7_001543 [Drosophila subpalustris]
MQSTPSPSRSPVRHRCALHPATAARLCPTLHSRLPLLLLLSRSPSPRFLPVWSQLERDLTAGLNLKLELRKINAVLSNVNRPGVAHLILKQVSRFALEAGLADTSLKDDSIRDDLELEF